MIQMTKNQYNTLVYWANVGYGAKGKLYEEQFPKRKSPWYKINRGALNCTVAEKLSEYILGLQKELDTLSKKHSREITELDTYKVRQCGSLLQVLLKGYDLIQGSATSEYQKEEHNG